MKISEIDFIITVDILYVKDNILHIDGRCSPNPEHVMAAGHLCTPEGCHIVLRGGAQGAITIAEKRAEAFDVYDQDGNLTVMGKTFSIEVAIEADMCLSFVIHDENSGEDHTTKLKLGRFSQLSSAKGFYLECGNYLLARSGNSIEVKQKTLLLKFRKERYLNKCLSGLGRQDLISLRRRSRKLKKGKPIWLFADRADRAGDNAEAFYRYLTSNGYSEKYRLVFAVNEDSPDFIKMQQYGEVVPYGSDEYKALFLAADKFISSQWTYESPTNPTLNPFRKDRKYVKDLITGDFIFLQHGVIMNDLSKYGHKHKRNVRLFITSAHGEYNSIVGEKYGYTKNEVALTGLARYDQLNSMPDKTILFMPTRRSGLERLPIEELVNSDYYRFYNDLINDNRLLQTMKEYGYKGILVLHPVLVNEGVYKAFEANEIISVVEKGSVNYTSLFEIGSMLVSDYSSTSVDFAYLEKPVIYAQYDMETFFSGQIYDAGYFSYENNGFGPVCYDYEGTVSEIIAQIEKGCIMDDLYKTRVHNFFAFNDQDNCYRILQAIERLG